MNTKNVLSFVAFFFLLVTSVNAQQLYKLYGNITDLDGNALQGASVLVSAITDKDTIVSGCITDADGRYETLFEPTDTIRIRASLLGYRTRETVLAVKGETMTHDIALERSSVVLDEVSVEAEGAVLNAKGISYYPNDRQKKSAYDGTSLLRNLAIPSLQINPLNNTVQTVAREAVALFIDGREASADEIAALRPKDVIRVEFYEQPMPEFMNKRNVVNYVVRKYAFGGYVTLRGDQSFIYDEGDYRAYGKVNRNNWSFLVVGKGSYGNDNERGDDVSETFRMPEGTLTRRSRFLDGNVNKKNPLGAFSASYSDSTLLFNTTLAVTHNSENSRSRNSVTYTPQTFVDTESETRADNRSNAVQWDGFLRKMMKNGQGLTATARFMYWNEDNSSYYRLLNVSPQIDNLANADNYAVKAAVSYMKRFRHNNSLTLTPLTDIAVLDNHYRGSAVSDLKLVTTNTSLDVRYVQQVGNKLNLQVSIAGNVATYGETGKEKTVQFIPSPSLNLDYRMNNKNRLNARAVFMQRPPSPSYINDVEMSVDELIVVRGNPDLCISRYIDYGLSHTALLGNVSLYTYVSGSSTLNRRAWLMLPENGKMVRTFINSGDAHFVALGHRASVSLLNKSLYLSAGIGYNPQFQTGYYDRHDYEITYSGSIYWMYKNFAVQGYYQSDRLNMDDAGYTYSWPSTYGIALSYHWKDLHIQGLYSNWFNKNASMRQTLYSPYYDLDTRMYSPELVGITPAVKLMVTYTFDFGKKVKRDDNINLNIKTESGLLHTN